MTTLKPKQFHEDRSFLEKCPSVGYYRISLTSYGKPQIRYSVQKGTASQMHPVYIITSYFSEIHFNINLSLNPNLPHTSFSLTFKRTSRMHSSLHACYMLSQSHHILLFNCYYYYLVCDFTSSSSSLCSFLHPPTSLLPLLYKYSPQHPVLKHPQSIFS
jgi:hypothetical protein